MPRRSFYDINRQVATKFPDYDQAEFEMAMSTIKGPEYTIKNRYQQGILGPYRSNLRSIKM